MMLKSFSHRLRGLVALAAILAIVAGLPFLLLAIGANPIPDTLPSLDHLLAALTSPDDGTLLLWLVKLAAWASWAFLTLAIVVEAMARARGVRAPRLPGLALPQSAARGLVSTAAMLFIALPLGAGAATAAPAPAPAVVTTDLAQTPATLASPTVAPQAQPESVRDTVTHTVQRGQTLWSIAQAELGDGHRWGEIHDLNRDLLGERPGFLTAGWQLQLPASGEPPVSTADLVDDPTYDTVTVQPGDTLWGLAEEHSGDGASYPEIVQASDHITQPDGDRLTDPDLIYPRWTLHIPTGTDQASAGDVDLDGNDTSADQTTTTSSTGGELPAADSGAAAAADGAMLGTTEAADTPEPEAGPRTIAEPAPSPAAEASAAIADNADEEDGNPWVVRTSYGVGALLAAGVLALLVDRRRNQQRRRKPGQRLPMPTGTAAALEQDIRAVADPLSMESVDRALRLLAQHCIDTEIPLPVVRAGRLTATQFDLYLAEPAPLPEPWTGTADETVWTLFVEDIPAPGEADGHAAPAPYPTLVTVGHDEEDGHVFLDLEHLGTLAVAGDEQATQEVLAALAVELATSDWADDLQITIVGAYPDLEDTLRTGRVRYLPSAGRILDDLERRAQDDRAVLQEHGPTLQHARVRGTVPDAWSAPEIVIMAGPVTDLQRNRLENLIDEVPRVALAAVTTGAPVGQWVLDLGGAQDEPDMAILEPIGLKLLPQRVPLEHYRDLLEIAALTDVDELTGEPVTTEPKVADLVGVEPVEEDLDVAEPQPVDDTAPVVLSARAVDGSADEQSAAPTGLDDQVPAAGELVEIPVPAEPVTTDEPAYDSEAAAAAENVDPAGEVESLPFPPPRILVLGPVEMVNATGPVEPTKQARLLEYAAFLVFNPSASHTVIDDAIWPDRKNDDNLNTRNTATSKLRRWLGTTPDGQDYLPRHQAGEGYAFRSEVTSDAHLWAELVGEDPLTAPTENLDEALGLVRGRPFHTVKRRRRYAWAEPREQQLIAEIVDAAYELGRRRLMEGRWRAAERAVVTGLAIEPAQESLWRLRILAAHESRDGEAVNEAIDRLMAITEELECDLEPETENLLEALKQPHTSVDHLIASI